MGAIEIDEERCKGCGLCESQCPRHLIRLSTRINRLGYHPAEFFPEGGPDGKGCTGCTICGQVCPETAISVYR